ASNCLALFHAASRPSTHEFEASITAWSAGCLSGRAYYRCRARYYTVGSGLARLLVPADSFPQQFRSAGEVQFFFDPGAISLDRFETQPQVLRNTARPAPLAKHLKNFQLAIAELLDRRNGRGASDADEPGRHSGRHRLTEIGLAFQYPTESRYHIFRRITFHDVTPGAGPQRPLRVMRLIMHG